MKIKIQNLKIKLAATAAAAMVLLLFRIFDLPCLIQAAFHIPCLSCGMTRACIAALHFDFKTAFEMHPMFWAVPILYLYIFFEAQLFKNKIANFLILGIIMLGFVINYIFVLTK